MLIIEMEEAILSLRLQKDLPKVKEEICELWLVAFQLLNRSALAQATAYGRESVQ